MRGTTASQQLRRELQEITDSYVADRAPEQIPAIEMLGYKNPHSISLFREAISGRPETGNFTCFQLALDLVDLPDPVQRIASWHTQVVIGSHFVGWLAKTKLERTEMSLARDGDLVLYSDDGEVKHAAKVSGDVCVSKWGLGHTWSHGLLEVPENFGSQLSFFRVISGPDAGSAFLEYAEQLLGPDEVERTLAV